MQYRAGEGRTRENCNTWQDRTGQDRIGQGRIGQDRTREERNEIREG